MCSARCWLVAAIAVLKKREACSLLTAIILSISLLPSTIVSVGHAQGSPALYIADYVANLSGTGTYPDSNGVSIFTGNPGENFSIAVFMSHIDNLIGYDITLEYAPQMLRVAAVDTVDTVFCLDAVGVPHGSCRGTCFFLCANVKNNPAVGLIRVIQLVSTPTNAMNVDDTTGDLPAFIVTFQAISRETHNSALHIFTDGECACPSIEVSGFTGLAHSTSDGAFYGEPNIVMLGVYQSASFATAIPTVSSLSLGQANVTLQSTLSLGANETVAGFAFVVFDVIYPNGTDVPAVSNTVILAPGDVRTVTAVLSFSSTCSASCGTYQILATLWRGALEFDMVPFMHESGSRFWVSSFPANVFDFDWADWDNDHKVTIADAAQVASCFDTTPSSPLWSSCKYWDLYLQNKVTIGDAALLASLFDQTSGTNPYPGQGQPPGAMDPSWKGVCSILTQPEQNYCNTIP